MREGSTMARRFNYVPSIILMVWYINNYTNIQFKGPDYNMINICIWQCANETELLKDQLILVWYYIPCTVNLLKILKFFLKNAVLRVS